MASPSSAKATISAGNQLLQHLAESRAGGISKPFTILQKIAPELGVGFRTHADQAGSRGSSGSHEVCYPALTLTHLKRPKAVRPD